MLRFVVALGLCCMAVATTSSYQSAKAANDLSLCLDTWTTLDAGGPVSDEFLRLRKMPVRASSNLRRTARPSRRSTKQSRLSLEKCSVAKPRRIDPNLASLLAGGLIRGQWHSM